MAKAHVLRLYEVDLGEKDWVAAHNPFEALRVSRVLGCGFGLGDGENTFEHIHVSELSESQAKARTVFGPGSSKEPLDLWELFQRMVGLCRHDSISVLASSWYDEEDPTWLGMEVE